MVSWVVYGTRHRQLRRGPPLLRVLDFFRHDKPVVHALLPDGDARLGKFRISEGSNWNTDDAGPHISFEAHGAPARGTKMETKLATARSDADILAGCSFDANLVLTEVRANVKD
jgi:hypothetical protein